MITLFSIKIDQASLFKDSLCRLEANDKVTQNFFSLYHPDLMNLWESSIDKDNTEIIGYIKQEFDRLSSDDKKVVLNVLCSANKIKAAIDYYIGNSKGLLDRDAAGIWNNKDCRFAFLSKALELKQARQFEDVFVFQCLPQPRSEIEWIKGLYDLALTIRPDEKQVNLVFHQGDIQYKNIENDQSSHPLHSFVNCTYCFSDDELKNYIKEEDVSVKAIAFSHDSSSPVYRLLCSNAESKLDIDKAISSIYSEASKISATIARKKSETEQKPATEETAENTEGESAQGEEDDPIGKAYSSQL